MNIKIESNSAGITPNEKEGRHEFKTDNGNMGNPENAAKENGLSSKPNIAHKGRENIE